MGTSILGNWNSALLSPQLSPVFDSIEAEGPAIAIGSRDERVSEVYEEPGYGRDVVQTVDALGDHKRDSDPLKKLKSISLQSLLYKSNSLGLCGQILRNFATLAKF